MRRKMKKKELRVIRQTNKNKKVVLFKPQDCLNYTKPNRNLFLKDLFNAEDPSREGKSHDNDYRERYRI